MNGTVSRVVTHYYACYAMNSMIAFLVKLCSVMSFLSQKLIQENTKVKVIEH